MAATSLDELKEAFYNFDWDKDGYLTVDELRYFCSYRSSQWQSHFDQHWRSYARSRCTRFFFLTFQIEDLLAEADSDGDGKINYIEFAEIMWQGNSE